MQDAVTDQMPPRTREIFQIAVDLGGEFSPGDYEKFSYSSGPPLRPHVITMEDLGLVMSQQDDVDKRRKTISITPKGWFVAHALKEESSGSS